MGKKRCIYIIFRLKLYIGSIKFSVSIKIILVILLPIQFLYKIIYVYGFNTVVLNILINGGVFGV